MAEFDDLTERIIGAANEVHRVLGPGLLESVYEAALARELSIRGLEVRRQVTQPISYKGEAVGDCRIDMIVEAKVVVEVKAVFRLLPVFESQLATYLKVSGCPTGLLLNFDTFRMAAGVRRVMLVRSSV